MNLWMQMFTPVVGGSGERVVRLGDTLHSGDGMAASLKLDEPAYLYLIDYTEQGSALLFPEIGDCWIPAGQPLRVPGAGRYMELDDQVGDEILYGVACGLPLFEADPDLWNQLRLPLTGEGRTLSTSCPPPPPSGGRGDDVVQAHADKRGIAIVQFHIVHAA